MNRSERSRYAQQLASALSKSCVRACSGAFRFSAHLRGCVGAHGVQVALCSALLCAQCSSVREKLNWEVLSVAATSAVCAVWPWLSRSHTGLLLGWDPAEINLLWSVSVQHAEETGLLSLVAMTMAFAMYVPVRLKFWPIAPGCVALSYMILTATFHPSGRESAPFSVCLLMVLLGMPLCSVRNRELHERRVWSELQEASEQKHELEGMKEMGGSWGSAPGQGESLAARGRQTTGDVREPESGLSSFGEKWFRRLGSAMEGFWAAPSAGRTTPNLPVHSPRDRFGMVDPCPAELTRLCRTRQGDVRHLVRCHLSVDRGALVHADHCIRQLLLRPERGRCAFHEVLLDSFSGNGVVPRGQFSPHAST